MQKTLALLSLGTLLFSACATTNSDAQKITVVTSIYPLEFIVQELARSQANIINLVPSGFEPHDYELTPRDMGEIQSSDLVVVNGILEPWLEDLEQNLNEKEVHILNTSATLPLLSSSENATRLDPHFWLDPQMMNLMTDTILKELIALDPDNEAAYATNAQYFKQRLSELDSTIETTLSHCEQKDFVTSHAAFAYLANRYGLNQVSIAGLSPEEEPSAQSLKAVVDFVQKNDVSVIFFESLVSPELSETIAQEVGADTMVLNPIEGLTQEQLAEGEDYFSLMQQNTMNLKSALRCQ